MGRERRRFERMESLVDVIYVSKTGEVNGSSLTRDVSENGIGLPVSGKIPVGTAMDITIFLNKGVRTTEIPAAAKVAWSKRNAEHWKPSYSAGLEFLNMAPADRERLVQYVKNHKWIKSDFERALEENRVPVLNGRGEFLI